MNFFRRLTPSASKWSPEIRCGAVFGLIWILLIPIHVAKADTASELHAKAQKLRNAAARCRERVSSGELDECTVNVPWAGQDISVGAAESLAARLDAEANQQQVPVPTTRSPQRTPISNPSAVLRVSLSNSTTERSAYNLSRVINQFQVATSPRYAVAQNGATYCNIFVWDFTRAMEAEIPHWVVTGYENVSAVQSDGSFSVGPTERRELTAKATVNWLNKFGKNHGWRRVSETEAQPAANSGHPTIAVWDNPDGEHGHMAVVRPGSVEDARRRNGVAEAQAGKLVDDAVHLRKGFNLDASPKVIQYWYHD
ncbi:MAG: hypothetical protein V7609_2925 [Verrucomicrobiota bacterium]